MDHIKEAARRLAAESFSGTEWYTKRKYASVLDELIVQTMWTASPWGNQFPSGNPLLEHYLQAAQILEEVMTKLRENQDPILVDVVEFLWLRRIGVILDPRPIVYTYNDHYHVYLSFYAEMRVEVEDQEAEYTWLQTDGGGTGVMDTCLDVFRVLDKVTAVLRGIPWGNLKDAGGRRKVIQQYLAVEGLNGYIGFER